MLFSEVYGNYFNAIAAVLTRAAEGGLTGKELTAIVQKTAFGESVLTIPAALTDGRWPVLEKDLNSKLKKGKLTLSSETIDTAGGFVLSYGGVEQNCTFHALIDAGRERLTDKVSKVLFDKAEA